MLGLGTATLEFLQPDLAAPLPAEETTRIVAAALMCGFRLLPAPEVNHEDILVHPQARRLQQFRDLKAAAMQRVIRFHFLHGQRVLVPLGDRSATGIRAFRARWEMDPAFRRAMENDPRFPKWHDALRARLIKTGHRVIAAAEGERTALARTPNFGGSPATSAAFAEMMDGGSVMG